MAPELRREEIQDLLGAFALDAVDDDERDQIERYLESDPRARAEVEGFREAASMLAVSGADAPEGVWAHIAGRIDAEIPPDLEFREASVTPILERRGETPSRDSRRWTGGRRWTVAVAAVAAAVIAVLGVQVLRQGDRIDRLDTAMSRDAVVSAAENARTAPGSRTVRLTSDAGTEMANIVVKPNGTGYFVSEGLPNAPVGDVYQLWALVGDKTAPEAISAGVLGPDPRVSSFRFSGPVHGFAVTKERSPGVVSSLQTPLLSGSLSA